jgi:excisionase family DNA binding protein
VASPSSTAQTVSLEEWAAVVGIGRSKAYELASRNEVPGLIRIGERRLRVSRRALDRLLENGGKLGASNAGQGIVSRS